MTPFGSHVFTYTYVQVREIEELLKRNHNRIATVFKVMCRKWPATFANAEAVVQLIEDIKEGRESAQTLFPELYEP
jgi:hypothetical protein